MTGDTLASFQDFYRRRGSPSDPRHRPILETSYFGVVSLAKPFGVAGPAKIWAHGESRSAEKEECAVHIAHEHGPQHHETLKLRHCQNKMG
jgi:hypothetical protein